jgi:hypothetical protein
MWVLLQNFPNITTKSEMNYEEFIYVLSEKVNLNKIYKAKIEWKWVEYFGKKQEKEIMELDSVKWLYNLI